jgi:c-di-GMP-binding flagellar brake protein YcgR
MGDDGRWEERRAHTRVSVDAGVWIGQDGVFTRSHERLANLSLGGAFIERADSAQLGSIFDLRIALDPAVINCTVIVRRVLPSRGIGVQFLDLSPEGRRQLAAFLERQAA